MRIIIAPFVGYRPDLKHPFSVATSHNGAMQYFIADKKLHGFTTNGLPTFYGFVVKNEDGSYQYVDRMDAYQIAKDAGQLKDDYPGNVLDSYMVVYDHSEFTKLWQLSEKVSKAFAGKPADFDVLQ